MHHQSIFAAIQLLRWSQESPTEGLECLAVTSNKGVQCAVRKKTEDRASRHLCYAVTSRKIFKKIAFHTVDTTNNCFHPRRHRGTEKRTTKNQKLLLTTKHVAQPLAATKLLNYGILGKRGKHYRGIEKFAKNARNVRCVRYSNYVTYACLVKKSSTQNNKLICCNMAWPSAAANALDPWFNICTAISMCEVLLHLNGVNFDRKFGRRSRGRSDPSCSPGRVRGRILWLC